MLRPPLSRSRLTRLEDGRYRVKLKKAWNDGTTHIVLDGPELIGRLAALVPPPRAHLVRYYGVLAPRARLRRAIVPKCESAPTPEECACPSLKTLGTPPTEAEAERGRQRRLSWAALLRRVFAVDVLRCERCGSRMQQVEWCLRPARIKAVLKATGPPDVALVVEAAA
jgi:hypothetical protein